LYDDPPTNKEKKEEIRCKLTIANAANVIDNSLIIFFRERM